MWPENVQAVEVFFFLQTQWLTAGMDAQRVGLNYGAAQAVLQGRGILDTGAVLGKLQVMEMAALEVFAEQARKRLARMRSEAKKRAPR